MSIKGINANSLQAAFSKLLTISGATGSGAKPYQERAVKAALEQVSK